MIIIPCRIPHPSIAGIHDEIVAEGVGITSFSLGKSSRPSITAEISPESTFAFLDNYARFAVREERLPTWSSVDVEMFIALILQLYISTFVTIAEILKNNGFAVEKKIMTSTVDMKDDTRGRRALSKRPSHASKTHVPTLACYGFGKFDAEFVSLASSFSVLFQIEILLGKTENFDELVAAAAEEKELAPPEDRGELKESFLSPLTTSEKAGPKSRQFLIYNQTSPRLSNPEELEARNNKASPSVR
ncbi:hypothetical protein RJ639_021453, partial [Escallonia herrerae]